MDAVYGLAETAMRMKKYSEAEHNYELYLQVVPTGSKAKHALKQLDQLAGEK
jgi:TolA-binding protein